MSFLQVTPHGWQLIHHNSVVAQSFDALGSTRAVVESETFIPFSLQDSTPIENGFALRYQHPHFGLTEKVRLLPNGLLEVERSWTNASEEARNVFLLFEVRTQFEPTFTLIPCVSYNGNQWGTGLDPKGLTCDGRPWVFSYKRVGIPSATFSENAEVSVAIFADDKDNVSLCSACSMEKTENGMAHRIFWPEREGPKTYVSKNQYGPARGEAAQLAPGESFSTRSYISVSEVGQERTGWTRTFDRVQDLATNQFNPNFEPEQVWQIGLHYLKNVLFQRITEIEGRPAFHMGLLPQGTAPNDAPWKLRESGKYEIGWCGQNAAFSNILLRDYQVNGNEDSRDQAIMVLDTWVQKAGFGNGLFASRLDAFIEEQGEIETDTCNLGWGAWQTMLAYQKALELGIDKPQWLAFGLDLCDFFVNQDDGQGRFGKLWTQSGKCIDWEGTIGCFLILPLLHAYRMTQKPEYLERAIRGFDYYVTHDLNRIECTAGALDTHCIDKETCWPLLVSALDLYEITGEKSYLDTAILAAHYTLSWMFHYNALYDDASDFTRYGYRTLGATSVSTQHHHLDPWGALLCRDWLRLYQHTGDIRWRERAQATWENSLLCLSDGTLEIRDRLRPQGSQNEAYCHCYWAHPGEPLIEGELNDWLVAWPGAFRLMTLMDTKDWDIFRAEH